MKKLIKEITPTEAAKLIPDGGTIAVSGNGELVMPDSILAAIESVFLSENRPKGLTAIFPIILGAAYPNRGADCLAHDGLVVRVISSSLYTSKVRKFNQKIKEGKIVGHHLPMSTVFRILRATASGEDGFLTKVGLGTFVDPRDEGGKINDETPSPLSKIVVIDDSEFLFYRSVPVDVSLIRGTSADEYGNISFEQEAMTSGALTIAMAAKSSGGITIAQVKNITKGGTLHPKSVVIPASLVDYIVVCPDQQNQFEICEPSFTGYLRKPIKAIETLNHVNASKIIARRAALELKKDLLYNLGVGIPADVPLILVEENLDDEVFFSVEHGPVGGVPYGKAQFGAAYNPHAILDTTEALQLYNGGCLDGTFLGMAELDENGNVNVSRINGFLNIGGFMDIIHNTAQIIFCGTFTSGGLDIEISDGNLVIQNEGRFQKMVKTVNQKSFNAENARKKLQKVKYITERAVFEMTDGGIKLIEIAPGIDLVKDVLEKMEFTPQIHDPLQMMDIRCFLDKPMGLIIARES